MDPPEMEVEEDCSQSVPFCPMSAATSFFVQALAPVTPSCNPSLLREEAPPIPMPYSQTINAASLVTVPSQEVARQVSARSPSSKRTLDSLGCELVCAICQQFFVEAATVECGHSFCRMCIENWLKTKLSCPVCRHAIEKPPIASLCLDKAVRAVLEITQEEETVQELMERKKQACMARENECFAQTCLETLFQKAVQQGVRVVHISKHWSPREQQRFLCGIERHQGVAREAYCKVVGLTHEWVGRATMDELLVAVSNVQLRDMEHRPRSQNDWKESCILKVRSRLEMYIRYG